MLRASVRTNCALAASTSGKIAVISALQASFEAFSVYRWICGCRLPRGVPVRKRARILQEVSRNIPPARDGYDHVFN